MKKRILSILLSLAVILSMSIPCTAFAAGSEDNATYKLTVWHPEAGRPLDEQPIPQDFYSVSCASTVPAIALSSNTCLRAKIDGGSSPMQPGSKFSYDQEVLFHTSISATGGEKFTGNETLSINGKPVPICFNEDMNVIYINQDGYDEAFSLGVLKRTPVSDIYLTGYKPVKMGTTPAVLSVDEAADSGHVYTGRGCYIDNVMHTEATSFVDGRDYWMHIRLDAAYDYSFENITPENIHIAGYDMPAEGVSISTENGSDSTYPSYIEINLPAVTAEKNIYEFTIPEPKEGELPGQATLKANDDIAYTGIDWYKSQDGWSEAVKMEDGEMFEAGYDYYAQPQYSWKSEELVSGSYTIYVNGNVYNGLYYSFSHLYREVDLQITVAEPQVGGTPAQTYSANIPISEQVCAWYLLPNAPSIEDAQPMKLPDDKFMEFQAGCSYAFIPIAYNYDYDFYSINKTYVNGVDLSGIGYIVFGPLKYTQSISGASSFTKTYGNAAFSLGASAKTALSYASSNTKVATVSADGKVTVKGAGTATITIKAAEDSNYKAATRQVKITVAKADQTVSGVNSSYSRAYGSYFTLKPSSKTSRTYRSSNTKVATVSSAGKVTIKGIGTAKITITANETGNYKKSVKTVTVKGAPKKPAISKVTAKKKSMTVKMASKVSTTKGTTYQIAYRVKGTSKWKYKTTKKQSLTIKKLKKGKKYQVKVRAYKGTYYSAWSAAKTTAKIK